MKERLGQIVRNQRLAKVMLFGGLLLVGHESYREAYDQPLSHDSISLSMQFEGLAGGFPALYGTVMIAFTRRRRLAEQEVVSADQQSSPLPEASTELPASNRTPLYLVDEAA